jgi:hypothetical protein
MRPRMLVLALNHLLYIGDASFIYHIHFGTVNPGVYLEVLINFTLVRRADPTSINGHKAPGLYLEQYQPYHLSL